jgi:hypothetical protein
MRPDGEHLAKVVRMGLRRTIFVAGLGAAVAYFFDPVSGQVRRTKLQGLIDEQLKSRGGSGLKPPWQRSESKTAVVSERESGSTSS